MKRSLKEVVEAYVKEIRDRFPTLETRVVRLNGTTAEVRVWDASPDTDQDAVWELTDKMNSRSMDILEGEGYHLYTLPETKAYPVYDWWEGNVHYFNYPYPHSDLITDTLATAHIWTEDGRNHFSILVLASEAEIRNKLYAREQAYDAGTALRDKLVKQHRDEVGSDKKHRVYKYKWNGERL